MRLGGEVFPRSGGTRIAQSLGSICSRYASVRWARVGEWTNFHKVAEIAKPLRYARAETASCERRAMRAIWRYTLRTF